jgi:hypothetical protein
MVVIWIINMLDLILLNKKVPKYNHSKIGQLIKDKA